MVMILARERLHDEIRDNAPVLGMHARAVGVEDACDFDLELMLAVIVEEQRFSAALAFVVAGARADRIDVAPIVFGLGMDCRIAIDLARRCLEYLAFEPLGEPQHIDRAVHRGLGRLHRIMLVMNGRGRTGEIVDFIDLDIERKAHIMAHELEARMIVEMIDIALCAGEQIVGTQDLLAIGEQTINQMRAQKTGAAGYQDTFAAVIKSGQSRPPNLL